MKSFSENEIFKLHPQIRFAENIAAENDGEKEKTCLGTRSITKVKEVCNIVSANAEQVAYFRQTSPIHVPPCSFALSREVRENNLRQ